MKLSQLLFCFLWLKLSFSQPTSSVTLHVSPTGVDNSTCGSNENTPCQTINYTVTIRLPSYPVYVINATILLSPGLYKEANMLFPDTRATFLLQGPNPPSSSPIEDIAQIDVEDNQGFFIMGNPLVNFHHTVTNLKIMNCNVSCIFGTSGSWIFNNILLENNHGLGLEMFGEISSVIVKNCIFQNFRISRGGTTTLQMESLLENAVLQITDSIFRDNIGYAAQGVGLLYTLQTGGILLISNTLFQNNLGYGTLGGAVYITSRATQLYPENITLNFTNVTFLNNSVYGLGAAIAYSPANSPINISIFIMNCTFMNNTALYGSVGGILLQFGAVQGLTFHVEHSSFINNSGTTSDGAAFMYLSSTPPGNLTVHDIYNVTFAFYNTLFLENYCPGRGAALSIFHVFPEPDLNLGSIAPEFRGWVQNGNQLIVSNCNFTRNVAGGFGGAIFLQSIDAWINDTIFEENQANSAGALLTSGTTSVYLTRTKFIKNNAPHYSEFYAQSAGNVITQNCTFEISRTDTIAFYIESGSFVDDGNRNATWKYSGSLTDGFVDFDDESAKEIESFYALGLGTACDINNRLYINDSMWQINFYGIDYYRGVRCNVPRYPCTAELFDLTYQIQRIPGESNPTVWICPEGSNILANTPLAEMSVLFWGNSTYPYKNMVSSTVSISCIPCATLSYTFAQSSLTWGHEPKLVTCYSCEYGADCVAGGSSILAKPGYWGHPKTTDGSLEMIACPLDYCPQNTHDYAQCNGNRAGSLCGECADGYSEAFGTTNCVETSTCSFSPMGYVYLIGTFFWSIYLLVFTDRTGGLFRSLFFFYQVIDFCWTATDQEQINDVARTVAALFDYRFESGGGICLWEMDAVQKQFWQGLTPGVLLGWIIIVYLLLQCSKCLRGSPNAEPSIQVADEESVGAPLLRDDKSGINTKARRCCDAYRTRCDTFWSAQWNKVVAVSSGTLYEAFVLLFLTSFSTILKLSLTVLSCIQIGDETKIFISADRDCPNDPFWILALLLLLSIGVAAVILLMSVKAGSAGQKVLLGPYTEERPYWEHALMVERVIMGVISISLFKFAYIRALLLSMVTITIFLLHLLFKPFKQPTAQLAHSIASAALVIASLLATRQAVADSFASPVPTNTTNTTITNFINALNLILLLIPGGFLIVLYASTLGVLIYNACCSSQRRSGDGGGSRGSRGEHKEELEQEELPNSEEN